MRVRSFVMVGGTTGVVMLECLVLGDDGQQTGGAGERREQRVAVVALLLLLGLMGDLVARREGEQQVVLVGGRSF
jgi:hypothetical protein